MNCVNRLRIFIVPMRKLLLLLLFLPQLSQAQVNIIKTIAGNDTPGYRGDNGPAINSELYGPEGFWMDKNGNIIIADAGNNRVRKITVSTGIITTIAGIDTAAYFGDGGLAVNAALFIPEAVALDTLDNVYIDDAENSRIRKIDGVSGIITTIAGTGVAGFSGDRGPATNARLDVPSGLCLDNFGNLFIAEYYTKRIRKINLASGIITTIAGTGTSGYSGDGGPATNAEFAGPIQVFADISGNIYVADQDNSAVRKIDAVTGIITTIAGNNTAGYSGDGGPATNAELGMPAGVYVDKPGNVYIADLGSGTIRKIDATSNIITTVAGTGVQGFSGDGGPATNAQLACSDIFLDNNGIMYIADYYNNRIRKVCDDEGVKPLPPKGEPTVWPNPVSDELFVSNAAGSDFCIYDLIGKEVYKGFVSTNKESVHMEFLPSGVYVVQVVCPSTGQRTTKKIVKE